MTMLHQLLIGPYRLFFPLGTLMFLVGILLWVPQIFLSGDYPVLLHRYLMLNGFTASFIAGFLMTAVPKFSMTFPATKKEIFGFLALIVVGLVAALIGHERCTFMISGLQALLLLAFLFVRIGKRKQNPPYSFIFIFVGLILWMASAFHGAITESELLRHLHYEGAIAAIILGVGSRLIPGILGHVEIVKLQRGLYERPLPLLKTVPPFFALLILLFVGSYFLHEVWGSYVRVAVVAIIGFKFWKLHQLPQDKSALTFSIWFAAWLIVLSFALKALWIDGMIHASHAFFINGIALLSYLIATRVLQSHGPQNKKLEDKKILYVVTFAFLLAAATRVSAYLMPDHYQTHLGYSSLILALGAIIWSFNYLRYILTFSEGSK